MDNQKNKKKKFSRIHKLIGSKNKATAEIEASKNPMKYEQTHRNMSIKGLKGVAF